MSTTFITPEVPTDHPMDTDQQYQEDMVKKAEAGLGAPKEEKLFAGKYKSEDELHKGALELLKQKHNGDLEAAYKELERGFHTKDTQPVEDTQEESAEEKETPTGTLDFTKYDSEYSSQGMLTDESIEEITKAGIPRELVDQYLEGLKAVTELSKQQAYAVVGGEKTYTEMAQWAKAHLTAQEIEQYNASVANPDINVRQQAIKALYETYSEANPKMLDGAGGGAAVSGRYESLEQLKQDQKDPRYQKDPAFRKQVMDKLSRSKIM